MSEFKKDLILAVIVFVLILGLNYMILAPDREWWTMLVTPSVAASWVMFSSRGRPT